METLKTLSLDVDRTMRATRRLIHLHSTFDYDPADLSAAELACLAKVLRRCASALDTLTTAVDIAQGRGLANELDLNPTERTEYVGRLLDIADDEAVKFEW